MNEDCFFERGYYFQKKFLSEDALCECFRIDSIGRVVRASIGCIHEYRSGVFQGSSGYRTRQLLIVAASGDQGDFVRALISNPGACCTS